LDAEKGQRLGWSLCLVRVDDEAELTDDRLSEEQMSGHVFLGRADEEEVVEVANVADAELCESEVDDRQQLRADARSCAEAERHVDELIQLALEAKAEVLAHGRVQREGQEAVGQVELAIPAAWMRGFHCVVDAAVLEVLVFEVVVEVARQVDDKPRLLAWFDDDVQRLNAEVAVGKVGVGGQLDDRTEVHVLAQTGADGAGVLHDGGRVVVYDSRRGAGERQAHALSDVRLDLGQLLQVCTWLSSHPSDGGQPVSLLGRTVNEGFLQRRDVGRGWERYGRQHGLVHVACCRGSQCRRM
jgi:hypothetical protein